MRRKRGYLSFSIAIVALLALLVGGLASHAAPVHGANSTIHLNRYNAAWGDTVTINGAGFQAGDTVVVSMTYNAHGTNKVVRTTAGVAGNGNFQAMITVPRDAIQAKYTIVAKDFHGDTASQKLMVVALLFVQPHKQQTVYALGNHGIFVRGNGFQAGETITLKAAFQIYGGNTVIVTRNTQVNQQGNVNEVWIPAPKGAQQGPAQLTVTGSKSGQIATDTIKLVYHPYIVLNTQTVRPGTPVSVQGHDFVPGSQVQVAITIPRNDASTQTLSKTVTADAQGNFGTSIYLPSDTRLGTYHVSAAAATGGFHPATTVLVSIHPKLSLREYSIYPGQAITVQGDGYSAHATITIKAIVALQGGGQRVVSTTINTDTSGSFSTQLSLPGNSAAGRVRIQATGPNGQAATQVLVQQIKQAPPTSTPQPTSAPPATSAPMAPPTAPPPTSTPISINVHSHITGLHFRYISIWYHTVRLGTYNHLVVQSTIHTKLGIWVHVYFPSGVHIDYYGNTDNSGKWQAQFNIPKNAYSPHSNNTVVTFQLWHGHKTTKDVKVFYLVK